MPYTEKLGNLVLHAADQVVWLKRRRTWPAALRAFPVVRLRSAADVADWLETL